MKQSTTETLIDALRVLSRTIQTDDGVVNACLLEAAYRMEELEENRVVLSKMALKKRESLLNDGYVDVGVIMRKPDDNKRFTWYN